MSIDNGPWVAHARQLVTSAVCAGALVAAGGGIAQATSVPTDTAPADSAVPADSAAPAEATPIAMTITETSIDGLPDDLVAGLVDVSVTDETEAAGGEVNFVMVEPGTDVETFKTDLVESVFTGGPFPDYWLNLSGAAGQSTITLDAGEYIVAVDLASNVDRESTVDDIVTASLTVGPGDDDAVIPENDGHIRGGDYLFDADVSAGGTITFTNSSDNQFHQVVLFDFGTNDPALVEENVPALLESEGEGPPPEGIDPTQINFEFAYSAVFGPGASGTFEAPFVEGNTYVAVCYIQDREGGLPHAIQHQMFDVFVAGAG